MRQCHKECDSQYRRGKISGSGKTTNARKKQSREVLPRFGQYVGMVCGPSTANLAAKAASMMNSSIREADPSVRGGKPMAAAGCLER